MTKRYALAALLPLASCQTTDGSDWIGPANGTDFAQAEETCETQLQFVDDEAEHPYFFVECMAAFGWRPKPGTDFASTATAPGLD